MTLDVEVVCPDCRRFWHGPPGRLSLNGPFCSSVRHNGARPEPATIVYADRDVPVTWLTPAHIDEARALALDVHRFALAERLRHRAGYSRRDEDDLEARRDSFVAEKAVAVFADQEWRTTVGVPKRKTPDVGDDLEVSWTDRPDGHLIVQDDDPPEWRCVLARGRLPNLYLSGWLYAREAPALDNAAMRLRGSINPEHEYWVRGGDCHRLETLRV